MAHAEAAENWQRCKGAVNQWTEAQQSLGHELAPIPFDDVKIGKFQCGMSTLVTFQVMPNKLSLADLFQPDQGIKLVVLHLPHGTLGNQGTGDQIQGSISVQIPHVQ